MLEFDNQFHKPALNDLSTILKNHCEFNALEAGWEAFIAADKVVNPREDFGKHQSRDLAADVAREDLLKGLLGPEFATPGNRTVATSVLVKRSGGSGGFPQGFSAECLICHKYFVNKTAMDAHVCSGI